MTIEKEKPRDTEIESKSLGLKNSSDKTGFVKALIALLAMRCIHAHVWYINY
jgi:hypothetical protein